MGSHLMVSNVFSLKSSVSIMASFDVTLHKSCIPLESVSLIPSVHFIECPLSSEDVCLIARKEEATKLPSFE